MRNHSSMMSSLKCNFCVTSSRSRDLSCDAFIGVSSAMTSPPWKIGYKQEHFPKCFARSEIRFRNRRKAGIAHVGRGWTSVSIVWHFSHEWHVSLSFGMISWKWKLTLGVVHACPWHHWKKQLQDTNTEQTQSVYFMMIMMIIRITTTTTTITTTTTTA